MQTDTCGDKKLEFDECHSHVKVRSSKDVTKTNKGGVDSVAR